MTDNKEIGGYFEMEELPGEEYYPDLLRLNLGRTALLYLLKQRGCREIFLPHYLCDSVIGACRDSGIKISFTPSMMRWNPESKSFRTAPGVTL